MVKLVDTLDLGSSASRRGGSSPFTRTKPQQLLGFFYAIIFDLRYNWYADYPTSNYTSSNKTRGCGEIGRPVCPDYRQAGDRQTR